ncbi:MAG: hypothetical protein KBD78_13425, partial [Oligoflexales bacterium]|nr:hypothetical protein [Oligoflexales bacterium]
GIWGLTRELSLAGPVHAHEWPVISGNECIGQNWGVALFNEPGGYGIGQIFPEGRSQNIKSFQFPVGTVSTKLLFTGASTQQVPLIENAMQINAMINGGGTCEGKLNPRELTTMRHIQMDVMMRFGDGSDDWIFGVFAYSPSYVEKYWQGMVPIGVQFGVAKHETVAVYEDMKPNGFEGRLNGPGDNPLSSCFSCHARAQWPEPTLQRMPFAPADSLDNKFICLLHDWGGEKKCGLSACSILGDCIPPGRAPIIPGFHNADYALQIPLALINKHR